MYKNEELLKDRLFSDYKILKDKWIIEFINFS